MEILQTVIISSLDILVGNKDDEHLILRAQWYLK